ncbi:MAG: TOBE domain-containing protein [Paracoccaceae bacterium]
MRGAVQALGPGDAVLAAEGLAERGQGGSVTIAVRPEKIALSFGGTGKGTNALVGTIAAAAYLGDRSHFQITIAGQDEPVTVYRPNLPGHEAIGAVGDPVVLSWDAKDARVIER